jgi:rRNA maturation RNase YbeY
VTLQVSSPSIGFFTEDIAFTLKGKRKISTWIQALVRKEGGKVGSLNFIFCSDSYLLKINKDYLTKDTLTDVIAFDQSDHGEEISGDVFISIERVKENARELGVPFATELGRVMVHGVLHLAGYEDKTPKEKAVMTEREDFYLKAFPGISS